jgi:hypothetical protein
MRALPEPEVSFLREKPIFDRLSLSNHPIKMFDPDPGFLQSPPTYCVRKSWFRDEHTNRLPLAKASGIAERSITHGKPL